MIKNILYSLFLHSLLLTLIYINFKNRINDETNELKEGIAISIASFDSAKKSNAADEVAQKIEKKETKKIAKPKKPEIKKAEKPQSSKSKPKPEIKEEKKSEPKKTVEKKSVLPPLIEKHNEFKPEEAKEEPKKVEPEIKEEKKIEEKIEPEKSENAKEEAKEDTQEDATVANPQEDVVNDLENLNLSVREKYNIQSQLRGCYHHSLQDNYNNNFAITIKVTVLPDGTISFDSDKIIDMVRYKDPKEKAYRDMMDGIIKTLEFCSPLRNMPADKYDVWKEFTIQFGGQ